MFSLEHNRPSSPDGFPGEFYKLFWETIKYSLNRFFGDFFLGHLDLSRLNFETVTFLPKGKDVIAIQMFRPIFLINDSLKIITKSVNNRLVEVADEIIDGTQTAFMKNRNILEAIFILQYADDTIIFLE